VEEDRPTEPFSASKSTCTRLDLLNASILRLGHGIVRLVHDGI